MVMGKRSQRGFVALDLLWILILLGLVVVLSMRGIGLVEKRDMAGRLGRELEMIAAAIEEAAEDNDLKSGAVIEFAEYGQYLVKTAPRRLREEGLDQLGGSFGSQEVGRFPLPNKATVEALGEFWKLE